MTRATRTSVMTSCHPFAAAAVVALGLASAASAQVVVLQSKGPSAGTYFPGRVLPASNRFHLKAGDRLMVKVGDETRILTGPGDPATEQPSSVVSVLRSFLSEDRTRYQDVTASRGVTDDDPQKNNLWLVDVSTSVTFCFAPDVKPALVRWDTAYASKVWIEAGDKQTDARLDWPAGVATVAWPESLALNDGKTYQVHIDDLEPVKLVWRRVEPPTVGIVPFAKALRERGCQQQFDVLTASINP